MKATTLPEMAIKILSNFINLINLIIFLYWQIKPEAMNFLVCIKDERISIMLENSHHVVEIGEV